MKKLAITSAICGQILLAFSTAPAVELLPDDDVTVRPGQGNLDESGVLGLLVKAGGSASFIEFALGSETALAATLQLYNYWSNESAPVNYDVRVRGAVFDFDEETLTHASQPDDSGWTVVVSSFHVDDLPRSYVLDITEFYNAHLGETVTFSLRDAGGTGDGPIFSDREGTGAPSQGPSIRLTPASGPPLIEEVAPDPETVEAGAPHERQMLLLAGAPPISWSLLQGPGGISVDARGRLSGWTPRVEDIGATFEIEVEAWNDFGADRESWAVLVVSPTPGASVGGGWLAHFYKPPGELTSPADLDALEPRGAAIVAYLDVEPTTGPFVPRGLDFVDDFAVRYEGVIDLPQGITAFHLSADEGARLLVDGVLLVETADGVAESSGERLFPAGEHCAVVEYFDHRGAAGLRLEYTPPGGPRQLVPPALLRPEPCVSGTVRVPRWSLFEISLTASSLPANPFTDIQLSAAVTAPDGRVLTVDGYHDGDGRGGQEGNIWKLRLSPDQAGLWRWTASSNDPALDGRSGEFECSPSDEPGPVRAVGHHFERDGEPVYLLGNFLDRAAPAGEQFSHTLLSEQIGDPSRQNMIRRHRDVHRASKINVYLANRGDYGGISTTPWLGSAAANQKDRFDLARWRLYDEIVAQLADEGMLAELWFFADDSGFGDLPESDRRRLISYGMARLGAYSHTLFVLALEWQEGWSVAEVRDHGAFLQEHNPWRRLVSVHGTTGNFAFPGDAWVDFLATQSGNSIDPAGNNAHAIFNRALAARPLIVEEFGILESDSDSRLRGNLWAAFCGGAAGSGTGSDLGALRRFIETSAVPFWRMSPENALASRGFVLAEAGSEYVVYVADERPFTLEVEAGSYEAQWFDPRAPAEAPAFTAIGSLAGGTHSFSPPAAGDWVLHVATRGAAEPSFARGDANGDGGVDVSDAVFVLFFLLRGGMAPACEKTADANDDGTVDVADVVAVLDYLFLAGPAPAPPFPGCGTDPGENSLSCDEYSPCEAGG